MLYKQHQEENDIVIAQNLSNSKMSKPHYKYMANTAKTQIKAYFHPATIHTWSLQCNQQFYDVIKLHL